MTLLLLATADDARGFGLAGVACTVCRTREDVDRAAASLLTDRDPQPAGIVLVSEPVYRLAPATVEALQARAHWPIVLVLPEAGDGERRVA
jgi:vacuolar-type H+-ATPase subunit F/Vma7